LVKNLPAIQETWVQSLGTEDKLIKHLNEVQVDEIQKKKSLEDSISFSFLGEHGTKDQIT